MNENTKFSLFQPLNGKSGQTQTTPTQQIDFKQLVALYKSEGNKVLSEKILHAATPEIKSNLKSKQPYYTPSGVFSYRKNSCITHHNNIASIDIDGLESTQQAQDIRNKLSQHPSTLLAVLSTRGKGVKALMLINKTYTAQDQYKQLKHVFKPYLTDYLKIDPTCIDTAQFVLSQPCFMSYDAAMYVNENAQPLNLEFNYVEPVAAAYVPVSTHSAQNSRIDNYLLSILDTKIKALNGNIPRHPQLYTVKILGQLNHYAPHLQSQILRAFINAGIAMYGKQSMRSNVAASVNSAFNEGLNNPVNNAVLDSILEGKKKPVKQPPTTTKRTTTHALEGKYLATDKALVNLVKSTILKAKYTSLVAPTGSGKSYLFSVLAKDPQINRIVLLSPLVAIVQQQKNLMPVVYSGIDNYELARAEQSKILACTYASAHRLQNVKDTILVIDEAHLLTSRANIYTNEISAIYKMMNEAAKVVFVTATPTAQLDEIYNCNVIKVKIKQPAKQVQPLVYNSKETKQTDAVLNFITTHKKGINVICWNDKAKLQDLKDDILSLGILQPHEIVKFTADADDLKTEDYTSLVDSQTIKPDVKLILATSKIGEGISINNEAIFNVLIVGNKDTSYFVQATARYRRAKKLTLYALFESKFLEPNPYQYDRENIYNSLLKEVQIMPTTFLQQTIETDLPSITLNWKENAVIYSKDFMPAINHFAILHEKEKIVQSWTDFKTFCEDLKTTDSSIVFKEIKTVEATATVATVQSRKARKETKKDFLKTVIETLNHPENAAGILNFVRVFTLQPKLKRNLKILLQEFKTNDIIENDILLYRQNFAQIERYVLSVFELMKLEQFRDYQAAAAIFTKDKNHTPAEFSLLLKRATVAAINNKPQSIKEQLILNSVNEIHKAFAGFDAAEIKLSNVELFKIMRSDLKVRNRNINLSFIRNKIGVCYDVLYDKHLKVYTLKNALPKKVFCYKEKEKEVTYQTHATTGLNDPFLLLSYTKQNKTLSTKNITTNQHLKPI